MLQFGWRSSADSLNAQVCRGTGADSTPSPPFPYSVVTVSAISAPSRAPICVKLWGGRTDNLDCGLEGAAKARQVGAGGGSSSGTGTNLKVGGTGPARKWGHQSGAKRRNFFWSYPSTFLALKVLVVLVSAFVMVSTVW